MSAATLEIGQPADGVFVLNSSHLDGPDLLAAGPTEALTWESILSDALNINARRGGQRNSATTNSEVGTLTATFLDGPDPVTEPEKYRPGVPIRLGRVGSTVPDFTGTLRDITCTYDKLRKTTTVAFSATDGVEALANTTRYGATAPGGSEPWPQRFARLLASSPVPYEAPAHVDPETIEFTHLGSAETGLWSGAWTVAGDALSYNLIDGGPVTRTLTGLTPGVAYRFRTAWEMSPSPITVTSDADTMEVTTEFLVDAIGYDITFRAIETSHTITVQTGTGYYLLLWGTELAELAYVPWAPSILTETNLARHLDIAATSASVAWMVDRTGIARVAVPTDTPVVHFSDLDGDDEPTLVGYTDAVVAYDTAAIVNDVAVSNHAIAGDPPGAVTVSAGPYVDVTSVATYGSRSAQIETAIAVDGRNGYTDGLDRFGTQILANFAEPAVTISQITINATDQPALADLLELHALVRCTWRTITRDLTILAIEHTHTPTRHQIVLTLGDPS